MTERTSAASAAVVTAAAARSATAPAISSRAANASRRTTTSSDGTKSSNPVVGSVRRTGPETGGRARRSCRNVSRAAAKAIEEGMGGNPAHRSATLQARAASRSRRDAAAVGSRSATTAAQALATTPKSQSARHGWMFTTSTFRAMSPPRAVAAMPPAAAAPTAQRRRRSVVDARCAAMARTDTDGTTLKMSVHVQRDMKANAQRWRTVSNQASSNVISALEGLDTRHGQGESPGH